MIDGYNGCGKTTAASALSLSTGAIHFDADSYVVDGTLPFAQSLDLRSLTERSFMRLPANRTVDAGHLCASPQRESVRSDIESLIRALGGSVVEREGSRVKIILAGMEWRCHRPHPGKDAKRYQVEELASCLNELE